MNIPVTRKLLAVQVAWAVVFAVTGRLWSDSPVAVSPQPHPSTREQFGHAEGHHVPPSTPVRDEQGDTRPTSESPNNASTSASDDH